MIKQTKLQVYIEFMIEQIILKTNVNNSGKKRMSISFYLRLIMLSKRTRITLEVQPLYLFITDLTFCTATVGTDQMSTFIGANGLPGNFLPTNPTAISIVDLVYFDRS